MTSLASSRQGTSRMIERNEDEFSDIASIRESHNDDRFNGSLHSTQRSHAQGVNIDQHLHMMQPN